MARYGDESYTIEISAHHKKEMVLLLRKHELTAQATDLDESVERYGSRT